MKIEIGSEKWKELRRKMVTATDAAVIMGVGFQHPQQLIERKLSGYEEPDNPDMKRGRENEEIARQNFEFWFSLHSEPVVVFPEVVFHPEHKWMMATVDGICHEKRILLEIKCPRLKNHVKIVKKGIPDHYYPQVQHQLAVSGYQEIFFVSYCPEHQATPFEILTVPREEGYIAELLEKEYEFWNDLQKQRDALKLA